MGLRQILLEISTRMGTRTLAVAVLDANSVMVAVKKDMKKLTAISGHAERKCSLEESHSERPELGQRKCTLHGRKIRCISCKVQVTLHYAQNI